jgi:MFS family permease
LVISGVATMVAPLCGASVIQHIGYASFFGFFSGGYVALTSIVLVDIVGIEKLSDAFGVLLLFIGVATAIGTPIVGEYLIISFDCFFYTCIISRSNARCIFTFRSSFSLALSYFRRLYCPQRCHIICHSFFATKKAKWTSNRVGLRDSRRWRRPIVRRATTKTLIVVV